MPFQDLTNLARHSGIQSLRTTRSESQNESLLLRRQLRDKNRESLLLRLQLRDKNQELSDKNQELVDLRQRFDTMTLQQLTTQSDLIKAARRDEFKHRLCSLSMISVQTGSEVYVESFGYGKVESTTFRYSSASAF